MQPKLQLADYFALIGAGYAQGQSLHDDLGLGLATLDLYKTLLKPAPASHNTMCAVSDTSLDFGLGGWYIGILKRLAQERYEDQVVQNLYSNLSGGSFASFQSYFGCPFVPCFPGLLAAPPYVSAPLGSSRYFTDPSPCSYVVLIVESSEEPALGAEVLAALLAQRTVRSWMETARYRATVSHAAALARSIRRLLHRGVALFCSMPWEHRTWFLLHGSHPPKASHLAFSNGCAVPAM